MSRVETTHTHMQCWCGPPGRPTRGYTTTTTTLERRDSRCPCDNSYEAEEARGARRRDVHAAASSGARTRTERGPLRPRPSCLCLRWKWNPSYPSSVPNGRAALLPRSAADRRTGSPLPQAEPRRTRSTLGTRRSRRHISASESRGPSLARAGVPFSLSCLVCSRAFGCTSLHFCRAKEEDRTFARLPPSIRPPSGPVHCVEVKACFFGLDGTVMCEKFGYLGLYKHVSHFCHL
jgi:hypothetical protein